MNSTISTLNARALLARASQPIADEDTLAASLT